MSNGRRFEGRTLDEALDRARERSGRDLAAGDYRVHEREGAVVVELSGDDEVDEDAQSERAPLAPAEQARLLELVRATVEEIGQGISIELEVEVEFVDGRIRGELRGDQDQRLTRNKGELLQAIQYLLQKIVSKQAGCRVSVDVDSDGFHDRRVQELVDLARRTATAVRKAGRKARLPPLPPAERRQVHMALANEPDILTESEGEGFLKRVVISLRPRS